MTEKMYTETDAAGVWLIKHCSDERIAEFVELQTREENVSVVDTTIGEDEDTRVAAVRYEVDDKPDYTVQTNPFAVAELVRNAIVAITTLTEDEVDSMTIEQQVDVYEHATNKLEDVYEDYE